MFEDKAYDGQIKDHSLNRQHCITDDFGRILHRNFTLIILLFMFILPIIGLLPFVFSQLRSNLGVRC